MKKFRIDILKSVDVENIPDNFWKLDRDEQERILAMAVDGTVIKEPDFIKDDDEEKSAVIADFWEYEN